MNVDGNVPIFFLCRWLLSVALGVSIALSAMQPFQSPARAQHVVRECSQTPALDDRCRTTHELLGNQKARPCCHTGADCFTFTLAENAPAIDVPENTSVNDTSISALATRSIAPPLPPPISCVFA